MKEGTLFKTVLSGGRRLLSLSPLPQDAACLAALEEAAAGGAAAFALRTAPFARPYYCDPVSLETTAAYDAAFAVSEEALAAAGGFDPRMDALRATDLIRRLALQGEKTVYVPRAVLPAESTPAPPQERRLCALLRLRIKFGRGCDIRRGAANLLRRLAHPDAYGVPRAATLRALCGAFPDLLALLFARAGKNRMFKNSCAVWEDAEPAFLCGESRAAPPAAQPLVSIITRTHGRPETLRLTLESLRHQTWRNFEIVLVEDGEAHCAEMLARDFADLPVRYHATGVNIGRAAAFNTGVSLARGEYLNMLDDDDYLLPEHLERAVAAAQEENADMVFLQGVALETEKLSDAPYRFAVRALRRLDFPRIDPFVMARRCVTTEQGVLFKKALCEAAGGMREELQAHEDWNLWLRMMARGSWAVVSFVTNCYVVPFDKAAERERLEKYSKYDDALLQDDSLVFKTAPAQLQSYRESVADDYAYLATLGLAGQRLAEEAAQARAFFEKGLCAPLSFDALPAGETLPLTGMQLKSLYFGEVLRFEQLAEQGALDALLAREAGRGRG